MVNHPHFKFLLLKLLPANLMDAAALLFSLWHCTNETLPEDDAVIMRHWLTDLAAPSSPSS
jgi:hypothetical protein